VRRRLLATLVMLSLLAVGACGGGDSTEGSPSAPSTPNPTTSSAAPTPTEEPLPTDVAEAAKLQLSVLGSSVAETTDEKAVVEVWMRFNRALSDTLGDLEPAPDLALGSRTMQDDMLAYADELTSKDRRVKGWVRDNVTSVRVDNDTAAIEDCAENFSFEVDADGRKVEKISPYLWIVGTLEKSDGGWSITRYQQENREEDCRR
jgi:hypothetical protein